ncbi:hypothetical protein IB279_17640 [Ensifer sp. ENS06]|uniref:hypothetical protein n=1 Tax=Ensifer sp. ENS06 TaxID=2769276 RepID=UPI00178361E7|nr:hypothetical protein [Ensifer sp. ENS06]MBD9624766.1 hypothetical protein [Ensifer sp. ENS06]
MAAKVYEVAKLELRFATTTEQTPLLSVSAEGRAITNGWTDPELAVWSYAEAPADGILDLDFIANPPADDLGGNAATEGTRASLILPVPGWVKGVRVHCSRNHEEAMLTEDAKGEAVSDAMPLPWPFPWYRPPEAILRMEEPPGGPVDTGGRSDITTEPSETSDPSNSGERSN